MRHNHEIAMRTKKNLLDAFWILYSKGGIKKTSAREIVSTAGYNRSTFYEYFTDVYDVLEQVEKAIVPDIEKHQKIIREKGIRLPIEHLVDVYRKNKKYFAVLLGENGDPGFREKIKDVYKALLRPYFQSFGMDNFALECTLEYSISGFLGVMTYCFTKEETPDIEKMVRLLWEFMDNGVMRD
ncbi:TetR/AcrR family transcriptional regulator [Pectinatus frisingensis]|uniref:TetR/AcrR family transcriptional regulator n=1 Tax=Pectinatus frisingensis TaxID=865 RepID=UPI0015F6D509|nr:TetR/AcrR family transcriptional regulator [Pectinatus frisingensis]